MLLRAAVDLGAHLARVGAQARAAGRRPRRTPCRRARTPSSVVRTTRSPSYSVTVSRVTPGVDAAAGGASSSPPPQPAAARATIAIRARGLEVRCAAVTDAPLLASIRDALAAAAERGRRHRAARRAARAAGPGPRGRPGHARSRWRWRRRRAGRRARSPRRSPQALRRPGGGGAGWRRVEVAGPGFLNMTLTPGWFAAAARGVVAGRRALTARGPRPPPQDVLLEFVSANPTGPPARGPRPPGGLRRRARRASWRSPGTASRASTTSTTTAARCGSSASRWRRATASWPAAGRGPRGRLPRRLRDAASPRPVREEVGDRYADEAGDPSRRGARPLHRPAARS